VIPEQWRDEFWLAVAGEDVSDEFAALIDGSPDLQREFEAALASKTD